MKHILYLILKNGPRALEVLDAIKAHGFNGTVIETASLKHALEERYEDHQFFSLQSWERLVNAGESTFSMYIVDENELDSLKGTIREMTENFQRIKGAMFSYKIEDYEGAL